MRCRDCCPLFRVKERVYSTLVSWGNSVLICSVSVSMTCHIYSFVNLVFNHKGVSPKIFSV